MVYRTIADLSRLIHTHLHQVPHDIDLVVGIPRSGMLPATMIALYLNKRVTDIDSFIQGKTWSSGERSTYIRDRDIKKVLIVDDSVHSGNAIAKAKKELEPIAEQYEMIYLAPIVTTIGCNMVDIYMEVIDGNRIFEWNLFHHAMLNSACMDIDGVLNMDPTFETDDDGSEYINFLENATPLFLPTAPIDTLISCRLEKYRSFTEQWLEKYNIRYKHLIMLNLQTKAERLTWNKHGEFKAQYYKEHSDLYLFIESSKKQAQTIADLTYKPVICIETNSLITPIDHTPLPRKICRAVLSRMPKTYAYIMTLRGVHKHD